MNYRYKESIVNIGPLAVEKAGHSWDLCEQHASNMTAPVGWQLNVTNPYLLGQEHMEQIDEDENDEELMMLIEAVRASRAAQREQQLQELKEQTQEVTGPQITRSSEAPRVTGIHPARRNLPQPEPQRHLRVVRNHRGNN